MNIVDKLYHLSLAKDLGACRILYKQLPLMKRSKLSRMFKSYEWALKHGPEIRKEACLYFDDYFNLDDRAIVLSSYKHVYGEDTTVKNYEN